MVEVWVGGLHGAAAAGAAGQVRRLGRGLGARWVVGALGLVRGWGWGSGGCCCCRKLGPPQGARGRIGTQPARPGNGRGFRMVNVRLRRSRLRRLATVDASLRAKMEVHRGPLRSRLRRLDACVVWWLMIVLLRCMYTMVEACLGSTGASSLRAVRKVP